MEDELIIRPARRDDLPQVERICANTWEWGDYIPEVWDEWLQGEEGSLAVAELGGTIVALGRVVVLPEGQAWLEGMRVDPGYRRRGIAWQFALYKLDFARRHGARVARLGTGDDNTPVHAMMERVGMRRVGEYVHLTAKALSCDALPGDAPGVVVVDDPSSVHAFLKQSRALADTRGLYSTYWTWHELSERQADRFLQAGQIVGRLAPDGALAALAVVQRQAGGERVWVGLADVDPSAGIPAGLVVDLPADEAARRSVLLAHFATDLRHYASHAGVESASIMLPRAQWLRDAFATAGYKATEWKGELWIYELDLAAGVQTGEGDGG
ncbi:MAG: GNAT family N-acetyltransferase [Anaerolineae bacterium]|nr:GNAT family N-acetyltransferase [Anaerolineae bacterium]